MRSSDVASQILNLINEKPMSVKHLAQRLHLPEEQVRNRLRELKKKGLVKAVNMDGHWHWKAL